MNEPVSRGLPALDDEYQGPCWWHFSRLIEARHSPGVRRIALLGLAVLLVAVATGILNVTWDWNGIPLHLGGFELAVTVYPPFVLSLLSAVWLGPTWGLVPAYAANLSGALVSGLSPLSAVLFALAGALEVLIFWGSMVTLNINPDLRRGRDLLRFALVTLVAPVDRIAGRRDLERGAAPRARREPPHLARLGRSATCCRRRWWSRRCCAGPGRTCAPGSTASSPRRPTTRSPTPAPRCSPW